jgi:hypothetical protein
LFPTYEGDRNEKAHPVGFFACFLSNRQMKLGVLAQPSNGAEGFYPNRQTKYCPFSPSVKESDPILAHPSKQDIDSKI